MAKNIPTPYSKRIPCELIIGNKYYVSFGNKKVKECILVNTFKQGDREKVSIKLKNGEVLLLDSDEIGKTHEEALNNEA